MVSESGGTDREQLHRRFRVGGRMSVALARIREEGGDIIRSVTQREPAKVVSLRTGITARHVYNLRDGECQPRWLHFIALAPQYPELRAAVARWLGLAEKSDPRAGQALEQIKRIVETIPEEGDQA